MRILMVGGCHLDSKHLAPGHGLTELLHKHLDGCLHYELETIGQVDVDHATAAIRHMRKRRPDVLIIQPGGMSCPKDVRARMRNHKFLQRWKTASSLTASMTAPVPLPQYPADHQLRRSASWWIKDSGKCVVDRFCAVTGRPLADIDRLHRHTLQLIEKALELDVRHIILLTPLPSADSVGRRYRNQLTDLYLAEAMPEEVHVVNLRDKAEFRQKGTPYLADTRHLNAYGNNVVAAAVTERVLYLSASYGYMDRMAA